MYLVEYDVLKEVLAEQGIFPIDHMTQKPTTGLFDEIYNELVAGARAPHQYIKDLSEAEKEYSFMHRWFIFSKR